MCQLNALYEITLTEPHAAYCYFIHGLKSTWNYSMRTTRTEARGRLQHVCPSSLSRGICAANVRRPRFLGSYIRGIHQVAMIHVIYMLIVWYKTLFFTEWCICDINYLSQHRAMAAISVYVCKLHILYTIFPTVIILHCRA